MHHDVTLVVLGRYNSIFDGFRCSAEQYAPDVQKLLVRDGFDIPWPNAWLTIQGPQQFSMAGNGNLGWRGVPVEHDILYCGDDVRFTESYTVSVLQQMAYSAPSIGIVSPHIEGEACNPAQTIRCSGLVETLRTLAFICVYIKREVINRVGYLDEQFNTYGFDDDDYCLRTKIAGFKLAVANDVTVFHPVASSTFARRGTAGWLAAERKFKAKWMRR